MHRLKRLEEDVLRCTRCPRLVDYLHQSRVDFPDYWSKPVPGFGDPKAWLAIVGLAPGLHGANKSGRPFYMDSSGEWLYGELQRRGLWDGEKLDGVYILNAAKCVPPQNKPSSGELDNCRPWLIDELSALSETKVVLCLGSIAWSALLKSWDLRPLNQFPFKHDGVQLVEGRPALVSSYHPSRQNTNTGILTRRMWSGVFRRCLSLAKART